MNITLHAPEECTLAEWADRHGLDVIVQQKSDNDGYFAMLNRGIPDSIWHIGNGPSAVRAVRSLAKNMACCCVVLDDRKVFIPKFTGIYEAGDWERFEV